jgi:integrase
VRGTKRKRSEGVWELRVYLGRDPETGSPRQISKTFRGGSREADSALRDLVHKYGEGSPDGFGATFGQLLDKWLEECERMELSPTTIRTYKAQIKQTIRPQLGKTVLNRLTPKQLDDLYGAMKDRGLSPKTIRNYHATISSALHQGVRWGWVKGNVAEKARAPRVSQRRVKAPSVESVRAVIEAAEERDPRLAPLLMLAALTGMRRGELCALRWTDVDLKRRELDVSRSIVVVPAGPAEKTTKTDRFRTVALDDVGVALLTYHRNKVDDWAREAESTVMPDGFVFSHAVDSSKPFRPDNVTGFFTRVRDSLGLKEVRLHDLRHFTRLNSSVRASTCAPSPGDSGIPIPR